MIDSHGLFNPETSIFIQICHPYTGNLNRETSGDSVNTFTLWRCFRSDHSLIVLLQQPMMFSKARYAIKTHQWPKGIVACTVAQWGGISKEE